MTRDDRHSLILPDGRDSIGVNSVDEPGARVNFRRAAASFFGDGLDVQGKALAFSAESGVDTALLSRMRTGKIPVPFHVVLELAHRHRDAGLALIGRQCELIGVPRPLLTTITLDPVQAHELARFRHFLGETWPYAGESYAQRYFGVSRDLLDVAIDHALKRQ